MSTARTGNRLRDIGKMVESHARRHGFRVIRNLYGHGVGRGLHEDPSVPSFDDHQRMVLHDGMVLAVEPFLSVSASFVVDDSDGWTLRTSDGSLVAQFEHTMVVTNGAPIVLTE
jgi:methionyl aminopeptidase